MPLPQDKFILLSFVNLKLRDEYATLEEFCAAEDVDKEELIESLSSSGFEYDEKTNSFR